MACQGVGSEGVSLKKKRKKTSSKIRINQGFSFNLASDRRGRPWSALAEHESAALGGPAGLGLLVDRGGSFHLCVDVGALLPAARLFEKHTVINYERGRLAAATGCAPRCVA